MLTKEQYLHNWINGDNHERWKMTCNLATSKDWDWNKSDAGIETYLGTLTEYVVLDYVSDNWIHYHLPDWSDKIIEVSDLKQYEFKDTSDIEIWSSTKEKYVKTEIKHTSKSCVDVFGQITIPDWIIHKCITEGAHWLLLMDNVRCASRNKDADNYGEPIIYDSHLIFYDLETNISIVLEDWSNLSNKVLEIFKI